MNINEFLEIADKFFTIIHPNFCEDYDYEIFESDLWKLLRDLTSTKS